MSNSPTIRIGNSNFYSREVTLPDMAKIRSARNENEALGNAFEKLWDKICLWILDVDMPAFRRAAFILQHEDSSEAAKAKAFVDMERLALPAYRERFVVMNTLPSDEEDAPILYLTLLFRPPIALDSAAVTEAIGQLCQKARQGPVHMVEQDLALTEMTTLDDCEPYVVKCIEQKREEQAIRDKKNPVVQARLEAALAEHEAWLNLMRRQRAMRQMPDQGSGVVL